MNVTIIGTGVYGKAMANVLQTNGCKVTMWTEKKPKEVLLPGTINVTNSFEEALSKAELVFILTGSRFVESVCKGMKDYARDDQMFILGAKGILDDGKHVFEVFQSIMPDKKFAIISGPTFAVDIAALEPIGFTVSCKEDEYFEKVKTALKSVKIERSTDILAIEMCGSLKNAYAIGSGILGGFNYGNSIRCLYITEVLREMQSIFKQFGCSTESILTLAGVGDLVLTCTSMNSRNFTFGTLFGLNDKEEVKKYLSENTVEGYDNLKAYKLLFDEKSIDAPILKMVYDIVNNGIDSRKIIDLLIK